MIKLIASLATVSHCLFPTLTARLRPSPSPRLFTMPAPPIQVFLTTIASQPALRQRQEYILRILQTKNIPFDSFDLASDEDAKRLWRRKAPADKQQLPGILIGGTCPGSFTDFEEAVEFDELDIFLRRNDSWDPTIDEIRPPLPVKPIGVPGASSPSSMAKPEHKRYITPSPGSSPAPLRKGDRGPSGKHLTEADAGLKKVVDELRKRNEEEFDVGDSLSGYGLQGVKVESTKTAEKKAEGLKVQKKGTEGKPDAGKDVEKETNAAKDVEKDQRDTPPDETGVSAVSATS
ncbi:hypothetical protein OF83DRAFT_229739 [Amylostereum chailletii]|nr:hypothetical protein OF83DRAFT_229739 [Amylostereum chailletii]